jgi:hypothetical protein
VAFHRGGPGSVSPANLHSTKISTITITYDPGLVKLASSGRSTQSPTPLIKKKITQFFNHSRAYSAAQSQLLSKHGQNKDTKKIFREIKDKV